MNLLILGATGGCGRWALRLAHESGHAVTAVVRPNAMLVAPEGVRVIRANVLNDKEWDEGGMLDDALRQQDVVLSCLGLRRRHPINPWSRVISPLDLTERVTRPLIATMRRRGVPRIIAISAAGVGDSFAATNPLIRFLIRWSNIGASYRDLKQMERVLQDSGLDWQAVRPVTLTNGLLTGRARVVDRYAFTAKISRADVAQWMLAAAAQPSALSPRTPQIAG